MSTSRVDISYGRIFRITWPVMLSQLSYTAMGFIDTVMVGRLGVTALAAVGLGSLLVWWLLSFLVGGLAGVNTAVAQAEGARDGRAAGVAFWQGTYMGVLGGLLLMLFWPFLPALMAWIGPTGEVGDIASEYLQIRLLSAVTLVPLVVSDAFYRGLGRTDIPLRAAVAQLVLNCGLNYGFIFGNLGFPRLGAPGAALGTVLAQLIVGCILFASAVYGRHGVRCELRSTWRLDPVVLRSLVGLSLPIAIQSFMEMGGVSVFSAVIARLGEAQMAATNAVIQNWGVAFMAAFGLSVGATTLVGQAVGARQPEIAQRAVGRVLNLGYVLMGLLAVVYLAVPQQLMAIFAEGEDLARLQPFARPLFTIVVVCLVLDLRFMAFSGALRGAGDTAFPMWVNIGSAWLVFVPAVLWVTPRYGMIAAWWCFVLHLTVMSVVLSVRFRSRAWMGKSLRERVEEGASPISEVEVSALETVVPAHGE